MRAPLIQFPFLSSKAVRLAALFLAISSHLLFLHFLAGSTESKRQSQDILITLTASPSQKQIISKDILNTAKISDIKTQAGSDIKQELGQGENSNLDSIADEQPYYFKSDEVSNKAVVITDLPSDFSLPMMASSETLILTLRISVDGEIAEVLIDSASLGDDARQLIIDAFRAMKFEAARIGGLAVPSEIRIEARENILEENR